MTGFEWLDGVEAPVFVLMPADARARIVFWNRATERLTGLGRAEVLGRRVDDVLGTAALRLPPPGGSGAAPGTLGAVSLWPVPGREALVVTLPPAAQDQERELFLGMAAHDLRTPLRNIIHLCEDAHDDPETAGRIAGIATRAQELLADVLAAVQASTVANVPTTLVELGQLCRVVFAMLDPEGRHDLSAGEATLDVERPVLQIVLRNLVDNAIRHGGAARLSLRIWAEQRSGGQIAIGVSDDGRGFDDPAKAFLSGCEMRHDSGFGLVGLRRLIRARGGTLLVARPENGSGSVVTVTLPGAVLAGEGAVARAS